MVLGAPFTLKRSIVGTLLLVSLIVGVLVFLGLLDVGQPKPNYRTGEDILGGCAARIGVLIVTTVIILILVSIIAAVILAIRKNL